MSKKSHLVSAGTFAAVLVLVAGLSSCKKASSPAPASADVFAGADFEDLPGGVHDRVNAFFTDLYAHDVPACIENISAEQRAMDIADDTPSAHYILEQLVDHPAMFDEGAPYPVLHKQFPGVSEEEVFQSIRNAKVTNVQTFTERGEKYYQVMGTFETGVGKPGKFCLRIREEPGSTDPGDAGNYFIYPAAVG